MLANAVAMNHAARSATVVRPRATASLKLARPSVSSSRPTLRRKVESRGVVTNSMINELALLAEVPESQVDEIFKVAGVMFAVTLVGLALGFVLLRVESLVEGAED
uniref:Uncharacterized protein n=1 Tax=Chloropicon laureae TaxID=464258 RepID=A0A7S2Z4P0_9CHLO|mmetsp:Transcript_491/g.1178  ORF Transcript_491/g.1178 Transcript_491/m.1178 type:complete len:106 (+) Transcript_491:168-485(+)